MAHRSLHRCVFVSWLKTRCLANIEDLKEGDYVLSRDQHDPDGPLVAGRISRKYKWITDHLQIVGVEDALGRRHGGDQRPRLSSDNKRIMCALRRTCEWWSSFPSEFR